MGCQTLLLLAPHKKKTELINVWISNGVYIMFRAYQNFIKWGLESIVRFYLLSFTFYFLITIKIEFMGC